MQLKVALLHLGQKIDVPGQEIIATEAYGGVHRKPYEERS